MQHYKGNKYKSKQWRELRKYILIRDGYLCQYYKGYGKSKPATMVHHIYPADKYPELFFNPNNLISLSNEAHNKMHNRETDELTEDGLLLQRRYRRRIFRK